MIMMAEAAYNDDVWSKCQCLKISLLPELGDIYTIYETIQVL